MRRWSAVSGSCWLLVAAGVLGAACGSSGKQPGQAAAGASSVSGSGPSGLGGLGGDTPSGTGGSASNGGAATASGAGGMSVAGGSASAGDANTGGTSFTPPKEPLSKFIVVDQFGYRPDAGKIAVVRDPQTGFDATDAFTPGKSYALVDAVSGKQVLSAAATAWNNGATDASSGDKAWWFDFSKVTQPGTYYVLDTDNAVRSDTFDISDTVYREVLKRAVRMLFYQRVGQAKDAKWAGAGWTDKADHVGPGQDHNCRLFSDKINAATEKDVWGGWFDAGDYNKYTNWTASYVVSLLRAYLENKSAWRDDYEIPESGNGVPDVLDEAQMGTGLSDATAERGWFRAQHRG